MIWNLFIKDTNNIGDAVCGPSLYFPNMIPFDVRNWKELPKTDTIILGGGGLFHLPSVDYNNGVYGHIEELLGHFQRVILWGVGHNVHGETKIEYPDMSRFPLIGIRDFINKWNWVPDVSCMSPLFDHLPSPSEPTEPAYFCHREFNDKKISLNMPTMYCEDTSFKEALNFIICHSIIYTNSYHGAYWCLLLGKTVVIDDAYSSKFFGFPGILTTFSDNGLIITPYPNFLNLCREINIWYYQKVKEII